MGGVCDEAITGATAEEIVGKGKEHVHGMEDDEHKALVEKMGQISDEERGAWMKELEETFEAAPEMKA
jgi:hypothetical protein